MPITVLAIADAVSPSLYDYFDPERWRTVDLVLSAGDLPPEYLSFLCSCLNVPVLYVRGNHDGRYARERFDGCENIHGRVVTVRGLRIAGFEGCRRYNDGPCQFSEAEMGRIVGRVGRRHRRLGSPDIVLTHAPPAGCHDSPDRCHQGFDCFATLIRKWQPALFVHGHMHAYERGPARSSLDTTTVVNAYPFQVIEVPVAASVPMPRRPLATRLAASVRRGTNLSPLRPS